MRRRVPGWLVLLVLVVLVVGGVLVVHLTGATVRLPAWSGAAIAVVAVLGYGYLWLVATGQRLQAKHYREGLEAARAERLARARVSPDLFPELVVDQVDDVTGAPA